MPRIHTERDMLSRPHPLPRGVLMTHTPFTSYYSAKQESDCYTDVTIIEDGDATHDLESVAIDTDTDSPYVHVFIDFQTLKSGWGGDLGTVDISEWEIVVADDDGCVELAGSVVDGRQYPQFVTLRVDTDA